MKIGIDIDNTITTTRPTLIDYCTKYNNEVVKRNLKLNRKGYNISNFFAWTQEEQMDFSKKYLEGIVLSAPLKDNAKKIIEKISKDNYIYIITARKNPDFVDPYNMTKKYLDENKIIYNELIVGCEDKYKFCKDNNIDIMIDDEPQNIEPISKLIPVIVFADEQNEMCEGNNIYKVHNWLDVDKIIEKI